MKQVNPQTILMEVVKGRLPPNLSLAEFLMDCLSISSDSAYRRMRSQTAFTIQELVMISERIGMAVNELLGGGKSSLVGFQPTLAHEMPGKYEGYVQQMVKQIKATTELQQPNIIYSSKDLPFFKCFIYPELAYFKHHFWSKVVLESEPGNHIHYNPNSDAGPVTALEKELLKAYNTIPSVEIWNTESINSTLFQIDFYRSANYFTNAAQIRGLYDKLAETLLHIEREAEYGKKFLPGHNYDIAPENFQMFYNQVTLSDNTLLVKSETQQIAVLNFGILSYLTCYDQHFCQSISRELENLLRKSTKLSKTNVRHRAMFFNTLYEKIKRYKKLT